jgi:hypothetical protein
MQEGLNHKREPLGHDAYENGERPTPITVVLKGWRCRVLVIAQLNF